MGSIVDKYAEDYHQLSDFQFEHGVKLLKWSPPKSKDKILDLGCGTGRMAMELSKLVGSSGQIVGLDPDQKRIAVAKKFCARQKNVQFIAKGVETLSLLEEPSFDLIFSNFVLHWIADKELAFRKIKQALKSGGRFLFSCTVGITPVWGKIRGTLGSSADKLLAKTKFVDYDAWIKLFHNAGFKIVKQQRENVVFEQPSVESYLAFFEATTNGAIRVDEISAEHMEKLRKLFPSRVSYGSDYLRVLAV